MLSGPDPPLGGIFGYGRCGSTWLGAIVSSHPDVAYRFEPFGRLRDRMGPSSLLRAQGITADNLGRLYQLFLPADPDVEKPPFFDKSYATRARFGRAMLWPAARSSRAAAALFRSLYTPLDRPMIVFKAVAKEDRFAAFARRTHVPLVYLLRHPCDSVASIIRGQRQGLLSTARQRIAERLIRNHAPDLYRQYGPRRIVGMNSIQKEALLWRAAQERCFDIAQQTQRVHVVFYEALCRQPHESARGVLNALGLNMCESVERFIDASVQGRSSLRRGEWLTRSFFRVVRSENTHGTKKPGDLPSEWRQQVLDIVAPSPLFQWGVALGHWTD